MTPKRVLVTGASGFIGSHLCRRLITDEKYDVHALVRPKSQMTNLEDVKDKVYIHIYDGSLKHLIQLLDQISPDLVYHLASFFISEHKPEHVDNLVKSNILFGTQLVEAMVRTGCFKLINTGTSWQHYQNADYRPVNLYAATKQAFEDILLYYVDAYHLQVITLKLYDTYGPDDHRPKLINLLRRIAETGEELAMSPGDQFIDIVHINDVVDAYCCATERMFAGEVKGHESYAVSSGKPIQLRQLVELFEDGCNQKLHVKWGERQYRKREVMVPWNRGRRLPEWEATISLIEGIKKIFKTNKT